MSTQSIYYQLDCSTLVHREFLVLNRCLCGCQRRFREPNERSFGAEVGLVRGAEDTGGNDGCGGAK